MIAVDNPRPAHKKFSLLQIFSRRASDLQGPTTNRNVHNTVTHTPARLRKRYVASTPPLSPARSKNDSLLDDKRSPSPHLTKDKSHRKDRTVTYTQRIDIPQTTRERSSRRLLPSSNSTHIPSQRVEANAIRTYPFPISSQSRVNVTTWDVFLPPAQVHRLYLGFLPQEMSDKWFIYSEGPDALGKLKVHFHRSWTGIKIVELFVVMDVKGEGAGKIVGIKWNGADDIGSGGLNGEEAKDLIRTTVRWVLGLELEEGR